MDRSAEVNISKQLESGESLIWAGAPKQGLVLRASDVFMIPFSILWGGFALFWEASALARGAPLFFALFGVPFVVIGLHLMFGRFLVDAELRANTFYGLTDRRVIIVSGLLSRTTSSLPLTTLDEISVQERNDRSGTVMFGRPHPFASWYAGMQWPGMGRYQTPQFELIRDARRVYDQVLEAQRRAA